ncbi:MAG: hypothetical protein JW870_05000 [Candidatus Delongbacteria bacterium]|jgi:hypothetical protein|nr:hypothetical protein [Candidatus Delongbacteria bacterium]
MFFEKVIESVNEIAKKYSEQEVTFLTESDFKVHLSNLIGSKFSDNITVNTESPWYDTYITNKTYYIDITAFDKNKLQITYDPNLNRKGYKYDDEALAIELKYFRHKDDINEIIKDFDKCNLLVKAPKNECFIIAMARTEELSSEANKVMETQMEKYRNEYGDRVKVYLISPSQLIEIK